MSRLTKMKYHGIGGVRKHIMEMRDIVGQLNAMEMTISDGFLVQYILSSLPTQFDQFKVTYNTQKEKWTINELTLKCVQEEDRLKEEGLFVVNMVSQNNHGSKKPKAKEEKKIPPKKNIKKGGNKCHFCNKKGHIKKDCLKRKNWFEKRGNLLSLVCFETNFIDVPTNTWWVDTGAVIHVCNNVHGFLTSQPPMSHECNIAIEN